MKRVNLIRIATALPVIVLLFSAVTVSAKEAGQNAPFKVALSISTDDIYFGGTVEATASLPDPATVGTSVVIDWGDGTVEEGFVFDAGNATISRNHLYRTPGQYGIVVIAVMPIGDQASASADVYVQTADETLEFLIGHMGDLVHDDGLNPEQGQSLINQLEAAQASLVEEQPEATVEALEEYLNELAGYIEAELVPEEDPSKTVADDMAYFLLADPRPSP
jgi:hypothetical protein